MESNTLNDPLPPNQPGVTDTRLESHMQTVLHSSFPLSSCRYSPPLLPESNLRHQAPSHARCWSIHDVRGAYTQTLFINHIPTSTTTASSLELSRTLAAANPRYPGRPHPDAYLNRISRKISGCSPPGPMHDLYSS